MDTLRLASVIRRRGLALLLCVIAGLGSAQLVLQRTAATYRATTSLIITLPNAGDVNSALQGVQLTAQLLQSYASLASSRSAADAVKAGLKLPDSADALQREITAAPQAETLLLAVNVVDRDRLRAQVIADQAAQVLIDDIGRLESKKRDRVEASVVDRAQPGIQIGPRRNLLRGIGLLFGTLIGLGLALLLDALDRTLKTETQLAELAQAPVLGSVPKVREGQINPATCVDEPKSPVGEAYRALRTAIVFTDLDRPLKTLLVTSPSAGEGKTTTASNLAVALAESGQRVVLIDADLRRGRVAAVLGLPGGAGLTTVVTHQSGLEDCLVGWRSLLTVLATGPFPPNPSEILGSQSMGVMLQDLKEHADVIIIDGAPILPVTDSVVLSALVDGVILVGRSGQTHRGSVTEAHRRLDAVGANVIGCVLNAASRKTGYSYYSQYRYILDESPSGSGGVRRWMGWMRRER